MLLEGCSVGPNYKRPVMESPAMFRGDNASTNGSFADLDWWQVYRDTTLQELVREAFTNNYDLRIAIARVEQARALAMQARSQFVPSTHGPVQRSTSSWEAMMPPRVPAGLPSSLLERRPDVRETEQLLRSANAQMGESVAEFFPRIGLTGLLGKVSPERSAFTLGSANAWAIAASGSGPLFEGGRLVGQYHQAKAARDEGLLRYRQTALTALRDVSDALISRERLEEVREQQARQVAALETAVKLSSERYVAGKASYYEVLEAQQQLFPAEINLSRTRRDELLAVVSLYKALGGGWQDEEAHMQSRN